MASRKRNSLTLCLNLNAALSAAVFSCSDLPQSRSYTYSCLSFYLSLSLLPTGCGSAMLFGLRSKLTSVLFVRFPFALLVVSFALFFAPPIQPCPWPWSAVLLLHYFWTVWELRVLAAWLLLLLYIFKRFFIQFAKLKWELRNKFRFVCFGFRLRI